MAIQFEDLNDILDHVPRFAKFRRIFLFDWSSGHAKAKDDGLRAADINMDYGGSQIKMRNSLLDGVHKTSTVKPGEVYLHQFKVGDSIGPRWMTSVEMEFHRSIDRKQRFEWKSDRTVMDLLRNITIDHGFQGPFREEEYDILLIKREPKHKLPRDRLSSSIFWNKRGKA